MESKKPGDFDIIESGAEYQIPVFEVVDGQGLNHLGNQTITFVRGSKLAEEKVKKVIGLTHESLMEMMLHDLKYKNSLVPSRETSLSITALEEALLWQKRRAELRSKEGIQGTYKSK